MPWPATGSAQLNTSKHSGFIYKGKAAMVLTPQGRNSRGLSGQGRLCESGAQIQASQVLLLRPKA